MSLSNASSPANSKHKGWVKASHWIVTLSFFALVLTGVEILMVHPRLYWGEAGNDLTPALFELPISRNYKHGGYDNRTPFSAEVGAPVSASRTYDIFNQNGWGRSLHFLSAWFLVITGLVYLIVGLITSHFRNYIWPRLKEFTPTAFWRDLMDHFKMRIAPATGGPQYGLLQKFTYMMVIFVVFPIAVSTGLTMSPAITAAYPFLLTVFGGAQSARTVHFFASVVLELFLGMHLLMIILSGFKQQIRYMTIGK